MITATDLWIIFMYFSPFIAVALLWLVANVGFRLFCTLFCVLDNHFQERYFRNLIVTHDKKNIKNGFEYKKAI